jgi:hypothetical protein
MAGGIMTASDSPAAALLIAAGWKRNPDGADTWAHPRGLDAWCSTDVALRAELRSLGWTPMHNGSWLAPNGCSALAHLDEICRAALAELAGDIRPVKTRCGCGQSLGRLARLQPVDCPSCDAAAVSGPTPGTDPPGEPEPVEGAGAAREAVRGWLEVPATRRDELTRWLPVGAGQDLARAAAALRALPQLAAEPLERMAVLEAAVEWYRSGASCPCDTCSGLVAAVTEYLGEGNDDG